MSRWMLLLGLTIVAANPVSSPAQTRLYHRGDSGLVPYLGAYGVDGSDLKYFRLNWGLDYTYRGRFDLGIQLKGNDHYALPKKGPTFLARALLVDPGLPRGFGLEFQATYYGGTSEQDLISYQVPPFQEYEGRYQRRRVLTTGLHFYHRWAKEPRSRGLVGVGLFYRFEKNQTLDEEKATLYGHDFGNWGFTLGVQGMDWGWLFSEFTLEFSQKGAPSNPLRSWGTAGIWKLGFFFGVSHGEENDHE